MKSLLPRSSLGSFFVPLRHARTIAQLLFSPSKITEYKTTIPYSLLESRIAGVSSDIQTTIKEHPTTFLFYSNFLLPTTSGFRHFSSQPRVAQPQPQTSDRLTVDSIVANGWPILEESAGDWKSHAASIAQSIQLIKMRLHWKTLLVRLDTLSIELNKPNLWDDHVHAGNISREHGLLMGKMKDVNEFERELLDHIDMLKLTREENDDELELVQAGAGGKESMYWASIIMQMYKTWAQRRAYGITVVDEMSGDIVVIKSGNHGGSSYEKTDSLALFIGQGSKAPDYASATCNAVFQVDIAPTLALLFGDRAATVYIKLAGCHIKLESKDELLRLMFMLQTPTKRYLLKLLAITPVQHIIFTWEFMTMLRFFATNEYVAVALAKLEMHEDAADMLNEAAGLEEKGQRGGR
ncbi:Peptide chain release factor prfb2 protein [Thalictrum thalictroides]|uniref:Peptide chain release factor prfb2 protein n=1 Tax=Thalictrum thalictroides TaxID=46969 RepID=A0A7J6VKH5_THATH|nr:Peptide chain release factor prfb2 protein [Thalictrum thalictroides]